MSQLIETTCACALRRWAGCVLAHVLACVLACTPDFTARAQSGNGQDAARKMRVPEAAAPPQTPTLFVASLGGGLQAAQQTALFTPFSGETGVRLRLEGWDGTLATLQHRAETQAPGGPGGSEAGPSKSVDGWDLVLMEAAPARVACREGLFVPKPQTADPANTEPDSAGSDCGVGAWQIDMVLAWDKSRVDMVPTWADFWDVARRPGKRGLRRDPRGTLEIALMADGVAPEDVYRTLSTSDGVDRAFRKLDQLKPYIVWWKTPAEAVQIIESGAVLMTSAPSGEIATADQAGHRNFGTQWAQSLGVTLNWAVPRTATPEHRALAQRLLGFLAEPARQSAFLASYAAAPTDPDPAAAAVAPGTDGHQRATLMMDDSFWTDHLVSLRRRFDTWLGAR